MNNSIFNQKIKLLLKLSFLLNLLFIFAKSNIHRGKITMYGGNTNGGSCGFKRLNLENLLENSNINLHGVAINNNQYNNSLSCGQCIEILNYNILPNNQYNNKVQKNLL
jgi:hypothetical protein